jgi:hypothetical protein
MIFEHINILGIVAGIVVAIIFEFVVKPEKKVVFKYPNPAIAGQTIYKDKNGVCFKYDAKSVDCDKNEKRLKEFPLQ